MNMKTIILIILAVILISPKLLDQVYFTEGLVIELRSQGNDDAYISDKDIHKNYGDSKYLIAGIKDKDNYWSLFFFSVPSFAGKVYVRDAWLVLYPVIVQNPQIYNIYYIRDRFFPSGRFLGNKHADIGVTWNSMPPFDTVPISSVLIEEADKIVKIDISRALQRTYDSGQGHCGLLMRNSKDFSISQDSFAIFYSSKNSHHSYNDFIPRVEINILREED